jgi:hypothetical protein
MAKKSSSNRQRPASQAKSGATSKTQATRPANSATLVHATKPGVTETDATRPTSGAEAQQPTPSAASIVRDTPATPAKNVAPKASAPAKSAPAKAPAPTAAAKPAPAAGKRQDTRVARARATQRARQAGLITPEHYSYVIGDLKLVAWLAGGAFAILIALTFFLPR